MGTKIYLSPSSQTDNACSGGDTEAKHCREIAKYTEKYLKNSGFTVRLADASLDVSGRVKDSNNWGADVHIPIHTNAGGGDGTLVMCWTGYTSNKYVKNVYDAVAKVSPGADDGIKVRTDLAEISGTKAIAVYVEAEFHDTYGAWIDAHVADIGKAIAQGICNADGVTLKTGETTVSGTENTGKLYKVQVGAFTKQDNAKNLVSELKADGFDAYYYSSEGLYKVQAGAFSDKSNADALVKSLKSAGYDAFIHSN